MKHTLLLFVTAAAISGLAHASLLACTVNPQGPLVGESTTLPFTNTAFIVNSGITGGTISNAITCPTLDVGASNTITSYQVIASADYQLGEASGTLIALTYSTLAGTPIGATSLTATVAGGVSSGPVSNPPTPFTLGSLTPGTRTVSGFNINLASTVPMGSVAATSGQVAIQYTTSSATPEPQTMALSGLSLIGLGFLARPKKRK